MTDWQPISSAPKDGRMFLIWLDDECIHSIASWDSDQDKFWLPCLGHWQSADGLHNITDWQPLPAPPGKNAAPCQRCAKMEAAGGRLFVILENAIDERDLEALSAWRAARHD